MHPSELNELTTKYKVKSGHNRCHPETCTCWNFMVYLADGSSHGSVFSSDGSSEVKEFLRTNDPDYKGE